MNEINKDSILKCTNCSHRKNILICQVCAIYPSNLHKKCIDLFDDERILQKIDNLKLQDGQFFSIQVIDSYNIMFLLRNNVDNKTVQIPINFSQAYLIQRFLFKICKTDKSRTFSQLIQETKGEQISNQEK